MRFMSLAGRNMKEIYRDPISTLLGVALPVGFLILFSSMQKNVQLEIFTIQMLMPGIINFSFAFLIMFSAILLAKDRQNSFLIRLFVSPLRASDYILAYILPFIPIALFQIIVCMTVGYFMGAEFNQLLLVFLVFILSALICISLGVILGSLLNVNQVSGIGSLLITIIGLFGGAWMDLKMVGGIFETIGYSLPFAHAVDASRELMRGTELSDLLTSIIWILGYVVILFGIAVFVLKHKTKLR